MTIKKLLLTLILFAAPFMVTVSKAAGMGMGPPLPCGGPFPPCPVPLDNGVILLLLAGAAYGGKKLYDSLKKNPA
ncbi:MAG: hypothetical protein JWP12_5 [Bacteroidetes bacterium]|nr:hypothetical protein [Bacteroidota bacterium]